jgi:hypothetical protein
MANHKRVYRIYRQEGLAVRRKRRRELVDLVGRMEGRLGRPAKLGPQLRRVVLRCTGPGSLDSFPS